MISVLESVNLSSKYLTEKGIDSARMNAELLLAEILGCKRLELYLKFDKPLSEEEIVKYRNYLSRRAQGEPLQYILGKVEFFGINFVVNGNVLIPRQETEILVETITEKYKASSNLNVLDIGTGSGIISICLAKHLQNSKVYATDISETALKTAKLNADENFVSNITFLKNDILNQDFDIITKFDIIVSNPPYVSSGEYLMLQKEIVNYEPKEAVTDNSDGYTFYKRISSIAGKMLNPGGELFFETGQGQAENVKNIMIQNNFANTYLIKDYLGIERVAAGQKI
ncbi:MAG: peptide chain release factor N(5)-glutamine methyltransferase [Ignavibacteria bacterium]|nr:peptide chain release factor N(5)-glutamine methyltransferase [Ignavibacteria bacterium]